MTVIHWNHVRYATMANALNVMEIKPWSAMCAKEARNVLPAMAVVVILVIHAIRQENAVIAVAQEMKTAMIVMATAILKSIVMLVTELDVIPSVMGMRLTVAFAMAAVFTIQKIAIIAMEPGLLIAMSAMGVGNVKNVAERAM